VSSPQNSSGVQADHAIVVLTTVAEEAHAIAIADALVTRRLAACVNIIPGVRSIYRWQGKICRDAEVLLLVKAMRADFAALAAAIRELHAYELPEILAFDVAHGDAGYLAWIADAVDRAQSRADDDRAGDDRAP
jgi:periplasmic divalent cation tolerance protein